MEVAFFTEKCEMAQRRPAVDIGSACLPKSPFSAIYERDTYPRSGRLWLHFPRGYGVPLGDGSRRIEGPDRGNRLPASGPTTRSFRMDISDIHFAAVPFS